MKHLRIYSFVIFNCIQKCDEFVLLFMLGFKKLCTILVSDAEVLQASTFRARCRVPVVSWCHSGIKQIQKFLQLNGYVSLIFAAFGNYRKWSCSCTLFTANGRAYDEYEEVLQYQFNSVLKSTEILYLATLYLSLFPLQSY